ncbi:hypothetical protein FEM03_01670 [Phragmitibacter flavus]|uniref:Uncharacterized protein n=1 Tax=Phragmitibacter flavus TaxID=2576071 RepID=A0A5R8KLA4_9BACT|nr:hypothetical protein [Phragmitibacter flavus]TLD72805.1 hypothetical protein FEM03_01670 [Phragmitibacter flavus]
MAIATPLEADQSQPTGAEIKSTVTKCDPIFKEVQTAVTAEPDKVLLIVEENILASQDCVCEIIKAAILATQADADLTRQIMLTALDAAPGKAKMIEICIAAIAAERAGDVKVSGKDVQEVVRSGKDGKDVTPIFSEKGVMEAAPLLATGDDYRFIPPDIRGVYLIQPGSGGVYFGDPEVIETIIVKEEPPRVIIREHPPKDSDPQSPSCVCIRP